MGLIISKEIQLMKTLRGVLYTIIKDILIRNVFFKTKLVGEHKNIISGVFITTFYNYIFYGTIFHIILYNTIYFL